MKLIAKRDFRNPGRVLPVENAIHPDHVHKGAQFAIGGDTPFEKLNRADRELVSLLNSSDCLADGSDDSIVRRILGEVAAERRKAQADAPAKK